MPYSKLLEPGKIGKLDLRNRIVMAPMGTCLGGVHGEVTARLVGWYSERAKGGAGLICVEDTLVTAPEEYGMEIAGQLRIDHHNLIPGLSELTESVHKFGAKISCQLNYPAAGIDPKLVPGVQGRTPSVFSYTGLYGPVTSVELKIEEIQYLVHAYSEAALRAKTAGFDAVELLAYHSGVSCFLSRYTNKRTDHYGGKLEGRMRFPKEVIAEIKEKLGEDFPLIVRMPADEFVPDGITVEEAKEIAKGFEECGVDAISLCSGTYGTSPSLSFGASFPCYQRKGFLASYAAEIKKVVKVPTIVVGALHFFELAEQILQENKADFVAIGRGLIADPELPKKLMEGRPEDVRRCIRCNECVSRVIAYLPVSCTVNVSAGMEKQYKLEKAEKKRNVLVVGGGPGGMEAARVAALRGHNVRLLEKGERLGGNLLPASVPEFKEELRYLLEWFTRQLEKLDVRVVLNKDVTKDVIGEIKPDAVIIATGAKPVAPEIPGIEKGINVIDLLLKRTEVGETVVIAGGGLVGCETALYLAEKGKDVTIVEMKEDILLESNPIVKASLMEKLVEKGIKWFTNIKLDKITEEGAVGVDRDWQDRFFPGDVVLALGFDSDISLLESLGKEIGQIYGIGDCVKPRTIREAIHEGFHVANQI